VPITPVTVVGAVTGWPSSVSASPAGAVASVNCTLRGSTSRVTSVVRPALSVARKWKRYQMLSEVSVRVGSVTMPLPPTVSGTKGWVWTSWWRSTHHVRRAAGSAPSSASLAEPLKVSVSPAWNVAPTAGLAMTGTGAWLTAGGSSDEPPPPHAVSNARTHAVSDALICGNPSKPGSSMACMALGPSVAGSGKSRAHVAEGAHGNGNRKC
jgi:hypothetical protein